VKTRLLAIFALTMGMTLLFLFAPGGMLRPVAQAPQVELFGWFTIIWGDGPPGSNIEVGPLYLLADDTGQTTEILLQEDIEIGGAGNIFGLNGQQVTVTGEWLDLPAISGAAKPVLQARSIELATGKNTLDATAPLSHQLSGSLPYITIMCKFADVADEQEPLPYFQEMYGDLDSYWREVSYDQIDLGGSNSMGWYTLPHPKSFYEGLRDFSTQLTLLLDCAAVADANVFFPNYSGINLMFNDDVLGVAVGGGEYVTLDGVTKPWPVTWNPPWAWTEPLVPTVKHEMGHSFGLPHSSGPYGQTYDNVWDNMSDSRSQHIISFHKDILGWIPPAQKFIAPGGSEATISLEQLALPQTHHYQMAQIPLYGSTTHFYTLETRGLTGYDAVLPGEAVIIHEVKFDREEPAHVIDVDHNGYTGDEGAMWIPGEIFTDPDDNITVCIKARTATGFVVTVGLDMIPLCAFQPDFSTSTTSAEPVRPTANDQITFRLRLINYGVKASGVVVTTTIPNDTTYVPGSATTSQGLVSGAGPLVFDVGDMAYDTSVTVTFTAVVDNEVLSPTVLSGPATVAWDGGSLSLTHLAIANGLTVYLPTIHRYGTAYLPSSVCNTPATPSLVSPSNGATINNTTPIFDWNSASHATEYQLQVDNNSDFSSPEIDVTVASTDHTPTLGLSDGAYSWRVRGHNTGNGCDVYGAWSSVWSVSIDTTIPAMGGVEEIVVVGIDGYVYAYDYQGNLVFKSPEGGWNHVATADLNNDGDKEIIAVGANTVKVYDPQVIGTSFNFSATYTANIGQFTRVGTGNLISNDANPEIALLRSVGGEGYIVIYDPPDTSPKVNQRFLVDWRDFAIGDYDGDEDDDFALIYWNPNGPSGFKNLMELREGHDPSERLEGSSENFQTSDSEWFDIATGNFRTDNGKRVEWVGSQNLGDNIIAQKWKDQKIQKLWGRPTAFTFVAAADFRGEGMDQVGMLRNVSGDNVSLRFVNHDGIGWADVRNLGTGWLNLAAGNVDAETTYQEAVILKNDLIRVYLRAQGIAADMDCSNEHECLEITGSFNGALALGDLGNEF
jgi:uncharacterized repeat protein (TIGR01451 family)